MLRLLLLLLLFPLTVFWKLNLFPLNGLVSWLLLLLLLLGRRRLLAERTGDSSRLGKRI